MAERPVYADFGNADPVGRVRLNLRGTVDDLRAQGLRLQEGLELTLSDGELSVKGVVRFSQEQQIWVADVSWSELKDDEK